MFLKKNLYTTMVYRLFYYPGRDQVISRLGGIS